MLREEFKLKVNVFEIRVPMEALGPRREEVAVDRGKLLSEEHYGLYTSTNIIWVNQSTG